MALDSDILAANNNAEQVLKAISEKKALINKESDKQKRNQELKILFEKINKKVAEFRDFLAYAEANAPSLVSDIEKKMAKLILESEEIGNLLRNEEIGTSLRDIDVGLNSLKDAVQYGDISEFISKLNSLETNFRHFTQSIDTNKFIFWEKDQSKINKETKKLWELYNTLFSLINKISTHPKITQDQKDRINEIKMKLAQYFSDESSIDNNHRKDYVTSMSLSLQVLGNKDRKNQPLEQFKHFPSQDDILKSLDGDTKLKILKQLRTGRSLGNILTSPDLKGAWVKEYEFLFGDWQKDAELKIKMIADKVKLGQLDLDPQQLRALENLKKILGAGDGLDYFKKTTLDMIINGGEVLVAGGVGVAVMAAGSAVTATGVGTPLGLALNTAGWALLGGAITTVGIMAAEGKLYDTADIAKEVGLNALTMGTGRYLRLLLELKISGSVMGVESGTIGKLKYAGGVLVEGAGDWQAAVLADIIRGYSKDLNIGTTELAEFELRNLAWALIPVGLGLKGYSHRLSKQRNALADQVIADMDRARQLALLGDINGSSAVMHETAEKVAKAAQGEYIDVSRKISLLESDRSDIIASHTLGKESRVIAEISSVPAPTSVSESIGSFASREFNIGDNILLNTKGGSVIDVKVIGLEGDAGNQFVRLDIGGTVYRVEPLSVDPLKLDLDSIRLRSGNDVISNGTDAIEHFGVSSHPDPVRLRTIIDEPANTSAIDDEIAKLQAIQLQPGPGGLTLKDVVFKDKKFVKDALDMLATQLKAMKSGDSITFGNYVVTKRGSKYFLADSRGNPIAPADKDPMRVIMFERNINGNRVQYSLLSELSGEDLIRLRYSGLSGNMDLINGIPGKSREFELNIERAVGGASTTGKMKLRFSHEDGHIVYDDITDPKNPVRLDMSSTQGQNIQKEIDKIAFHNISTKADVEMSRLQTLPSSSAPISSVVPDLLKIKGFKDLGIWTFGDIFRKIEKIQSARGFGETTGALITSVFPSTRQMLISLPIIAGVEGYKYWENGDLLTPEDLVKDGFILMLLNPALAGLGALGDLIASCPELRDQLIGMIKGLVN